MYNQSFVVNANNTSETISNPYDNKKIYNYLLSLVGTGIKAGKYSIKIDATNSTGTSEKSKPYILTIYAPNKPVINSDDCYAINSGIQLFWVLNGEGSGPVQSFTINYNNNSIILPINDVSYDNGVYAYFLKNLVSYTTYQITIQASNEYGISEPSSPVLQITTLYEAPVIFSLTGESTTSIQIVWKNSPPYLETDTYNNSFIIYYSILGSSDIKNIIIPKSVTEYNGPNASYTYILNNNSPYDAVLDSGTTYNIFIRGVKSIENSEYTQISQPKQGATLPVPPAITYLNGTSQNGVEIKCTQDIQSRISYFTISYQPFDKSLISQQINASNNNTGTYSATLNNMLTYIPQLDYSFNITCTDIFGGTSDASTIQYIPPCSYNLSTTSYTDSSITINWNQSAPNYGGYNIIDMDVYYSIVGDSFSNYVTVSYTQPSYSTTITELDTINNNYILYIQTNNILTNNMTTDSSLYSDYVSLRPIESNWYLITTVDNEKFIYPYNTSPISKVIVKTITIGVLTEGDIDSRLNTWVIDGVNLQTIFNITVPKMIRQNTMPTGGTPGLYWYYGPNGSIYTHYTIIVPSIKTTSRTPT